MGIRPDLPATAAHVAAPVRTRFAPSPTGYLHLGHVVNAIYVWGVARALGGAVVLRIEDHDRLRARPGYEDALREDLAWLGFQPDDGWDPPIRQSERGATYLRALETLQAAGLVYACDCSRREIGGEYYSGRCRTRGLALSSGRGVRVVLFQGSETFTDLLLGAQTQEPAQQCGDLLVRDRDDHWTYQFAATVDDWRQDMTLVVRGEDLLASTGRQMRLARLLGRANPPAFLHHPLVLGSGGAKLSKAAGDTGVRDLRRAGASPGDVIGLAAAAVGLTPPGLPVPADRVRELFEARDRAAGTVLG